MVSLVGNLSAKGLSFFVDRELRTEIPQNAILNAKGQTIEFYIGTREKRNSSARLGTILSLEENYKVFMLDMIQEVDNEYFRNYDNIESLHIDYEFDGEAFMVNFLHSMYNTSFHNVLEFLSLGIMGSSNIRTVLKRLVKEPRRDEFCEEDYKPHYEIAPPKGFWNTLDETQWPPSSYYRFVTDFYTDPLERDRVSIWTQWKNNQYIRKALTNKYYMDGFVYDEDNYNYLNDVYPTHASLLRDAWRLGGFEIQWDEFRVNKDEIYNKMKYWYKDRASIFGGDSSFSFSADAKTVRGFTYISRLEYDYIYERDKHILEELLGPLHCIAINQQGDCIVYGYGDFLDNLGAEEEQELLYNINNPDGIIRSDSGEHAVFTIISSTGLVSTSDSVIQSQATRDRLINDKAISTNDLMFAIQNNLGKLGGQTIYNKGTGNEHEYFMPFGQFLESRGWSLDDFIVNYQDLIDMNISSLKNSLYSKNELVRVRDFLEFYDKDHRSPFDGIEVYIPTGLYVSDENGIIGSYSKKHVSVDLNGIETISNVGSFPIYNGDITIPFDKDEFVSEIKFDAVNTILSIYSKIKATIIFKDTMPTVDDVKIRIATSDFTYLNQREFEIK